MRQRTAIATAALILALGCLALVLLWPADTTAPEPAPGAAPPELRTTTGPAFEPSTADATADRPGTPGATAPIHGRVVYCDPDQRPANDLFVEAHSADNTEAATATDTEGRFTLQVSANQSCTVTVRVPDGWAPRTAPDFTPGSSDEPVIELAPTNGVIAGKMRIQDHIYWRDLARMVDDAESILDVYGILTKSAKTGRPAANATVVAKGPVGTYRTTTDGQGRFRFDTLVRGPFSVYVDTDAHTRTRPGRVSLDLTRSPTHDDIEFLVETPTLTVEGTVVDTRGRPVPEATVQAITGGKSVEASATTDDTGAFVLKGVPTAAVLTAANVLRIPNFGAQSLTAAAPGYATTKMLFPVVAEGPRQVADAYHALRWRQSETPGKPQVVGDITTPEDNTIGGVTIVLPASAAIEVTVRDRAGKPMPNLPASLTRLSEDLAMNPARFPRDATVLPTDANGRARFADLSPGTYQVSASATPADLPAISDPIPLAAGQVATGITLTVENAPKGAIAGTVYDERTGEPSKTKFSIFATTEWANPAERVLASVYDIARRESAAVPYLPTANHIAIPQRDDNFDGNTDGYRIDGVLPGRVHVQLRLPKGAIMMREVEVRPGETTPCDFYVATGDAFIHIANSDANTHAVIAQVYFQPEPAKDQRLETPGARSPEGFLLSDLTPGRYRVEITRIHRQADTEATMFLTQTPGIVKNVEFEVVSGETTTVQVAFTGTASVTGRITGTGNGDITGVLLLPRGGPDPNHPVSRATAPANRFAINELDPGDYTVVVTFTDVSRNIDHLEIRRDITLTENQSTDLTIDIAQP